MSKRSLGDEIVGVSTGELGKCVRRQRRDHEQVGLGEVDIEVLRGRPPRQRKKGLGAHEPLSPRRNERHHLVTPLDE